jgi:hypothetical protein
VRNSLPIPAAALSDHLEITGRVADIQVKRGPATFGTLRI